MTLLDQKQIEQFWRDGYLCLPLFFHPHDIGLIRDEYRRIWLPQLRILGILPDDTKHQPPWSELKKAIACMRENHPVQYDNCRKQVKRTLAVYRLAIDERILNVIRQLGLSAPTLHQRPHLVADHILTYQNDQLWKTWHPSCNAIAAFMYLDDDIGMNSTTLDDLLQLVPGSHTGGLRTMTDIHRIPDEGYEALPISNQDAMYGTDLILFSPLMVSRLPNSVNSLDTLMWCYSDMDDVFYLQHNYRPLVSAPVGDALIEFLATKSC